MTEGGWSISTSIWLMVLMSLAFVVGHKSPPTTLDDHVTRCILFTTRHPGAQFPNPWLVKHACADAGLTIADAACKAAVTFRDKELSGLRNPDLLVEYINNCGPLEKDDTQ